MHSENALNFCLSNSYSSWQKNQPGTPHQSCLGWALSFSERAWGGSLRQPPSRFTESLFPIPPASLLPSSFLSSTLLLVWGFLLALAPHPCICFLLLTSLAFLSPTPHPQQTHPSIVSPFTSYNITADHTGNSKAVTWPPLKVMAQGIEWKRESALNKADLISSKWFVKPLQNSP